jgi:hypothetical protein
LIRWQTIKRDAGGERREIGPGTKVNSKPGEWVERFDLEGCKNPEGERRFKNRVKLLN